MNGIRLTPVQRSRLERQLKETSEVRVYRRTLAILESERGRSISRIAESLGVHRRSVHRWIASYLHAFDPSVLEEQPRSGRPRRRSEECLDRLEQLLPTSPEDLGYFAVCWTVPLLREHLARTTGQVLSDETIRRGLGELGYAWKRPRYVLAADPQREKKKTNSAANPGFAWSQRAAGGR